METQFNAKYDSRVSEAKSGFLDLDNNILLGRAFVDGEKGESPLMVEFDMVARSYIYDLYDNIGAYSNKEMVPIELDATKPIEP